ncbi:hypothetical protein PENTCL1PPCAC_27579, partial [Pristionchus entomophagus]
VVYTGMASEETTIEVADFEFHALLKVRLTREPLTGDTFKRLAISSSYGIGIAIVATNRLLSFHTADVHSHKANRTNINEEVTNLRTRTTNYFDEKASLVAVSCNCDGSLVGVLADTAAGPMVHIFDAAAFSLDYQGHISPISGVRISADVGAAARCFEWSPAAADTLVAAASDRTLMTVAVKAESSSYTMMGERKLGAAVRTISWSRKGKQLVIGDDLGKVIQMKPELDIVRSTMPPDACKLANPAVVGLCWMATTEFLVVYGSQTSKDVQSTIMITKKDKPITWTDLPDLSYGSPQSQLSPAVNALCLLEWNAILTTNTKSSDVGLVGKAGETWQVWVPDELHQAALPTNAANAETFPVGAELDLSASEQLILSEDGQKRASASPIISILTNDGLLMSYHTVSLKPASPSMQVPRKAVNLAAVRVGAKPEGAGGQTVSAAAAAPAVAAQASVFGAASATPTAAATPPHPAAPAAAAAPTSQLLAQLAQTPICSPNVKPPGTPAAAGNLFGAAPAAPVVQPRVGPTAEASAAAATAAAAAQTAAAADAAKAEQQRKLVEDRGKVNTLLQEVQNEATALVDEMKRMKEITTATRPTIAELERVGKEEETQKLHGIDGYAKEIEEEERRQERLLKTATIRISDRLRMVEEAGEGGGALATMKKDYDYDREESISQLQRRITNARTTMAEVQKELQQRMKSGTQQNRQGFKSDSKWTSDRVERVNATIKNIQNIVKIEREKIEDTEALVKNVMLLKLSDDEARREKQGLERDEKHENVKTVMIKKQSSSTTRDRKQLTNEEKAAARNRLITANTKSLFPFPGPRRFVPEHQSSAAAALNESVMTHKSSSLNQSLSSANNRTFNVNSPLRAQLEERLLEVTKPRKAIQLPSLEKFSIKQESRPAALRQSPSPIVAAASADRPTAAPSPIGMIGGAKAVPAFRLSAPQASSTPKQPAAPAAPVGSGPSSAANLFKPVVPAPAKTPEKPKTDEEERKKKEEKSATDAAAAATSSIFGAAPTTSSSSIFGKSVAAPAADANSAAAATPAAPTKKEEEKAKEEAKKPLYSFDSPSTTAAPATDPTAAAAKPATSSIFGGGVTTDATKPATSSIFGGGAATDPAKPATSSIFGAGVTTDVTKQPNSIFGGGAAPAATAAAVTPPKTSFFGTPAAPVSSPFGAAAPATPQQQPKSIFGGGVAAAPAPSSPFGAATATSPPPATTTSSIFGGGVAQQLQQQPSSPFGSSFGKPAAAASASGFSFKSAAAAAASDNQQQPPSGFGQSSSIFGGGVSQPAVSSGFGSAPAATSSSFGSIFGGAASKPAASSFAAAAAAAAADEGMDDGGSTS